MCRHRGNKLLWNDFPGEEVSGTCRQFTCKYHAWRYSLDGDLTFVQQEGEFFDLDKSQYGLVSVRPVAGHVAGMSEIVERTREDRFEELFREHYRAVRGYALRRASGDLAQDVVSETFLVAWRRLDDVPDDALPMAVWRRATCVGQPTPFDRPQLGPRAAAGNNRRCELGLGRSRREPGRGRGPADGARPAVGA